MNFLVRIVAAASLMFATADITGKGSTSFTPSMRRCTVLARFRNLEIPNRNNQKFPVKGKGDRFTSVACLKGDWRLMMSDKNFNKRKLIQTKLSFLLPKPPISKSSSTASNSVQIRGCGSGLKRKFDTMKEADGVESHGDLTLSYQEVDEKKSKQISEEKETGVSVPKEDCQTTNVGDSEDMDEIGKIKEYTSQDLNRSLSDSEHLGDSHQDEYTVHKAGKTGPDEPEWRGTPLVDLKNSHKYKPTLSSLEETRDHSVFVKYPFQYQEDTMPIPYPPQSKDKWDGQHVRMPFSHHNEYPQDGKNGNVQLTKRWNMIQEALSQNIKGSFELEEAILSYNQRYSNKWKFTAFHYYFNKTLKADERDMFFSTTLKLLVRLALDLPKLCTKPIPLLKAGEKKSLTFSQVQVASLLANAFFCTFPRRNSRARGTEYASYPDINFNNLYHAEPHSIPRKVQKLKCILNYFNRVLHKCPTGLVTFTRKVEKEHDWSDDQEMLTKLHVSSSGTIEDDGKGMLQVDFANKYIGGGVLGHGCVQEEIRFLICPEMIVARLFTEVLEPLECLVMTGCEQFSKYTGYADTFQWAGNFVDTTPRDSWGRRCTEVVAIDALVFHGDYKKQFQRTNIRRELNKAFCGFSTKVIENSRTAVCTGNWGCGAFGGDKQLKSLIQVVAASAARRDVCYFTFGDMELTESLYEIHKLLCDSNRTIEEVVTLMERYLHSSHSGRHSLFDYIRAVHKGYQEQNNLPDCDDGSHESGWDN